MAYLAKARLEGAGASAAAVEEMLERAARALGQGIGGVEYLDDEQVIETAKEEGLGEHRFHGRKIIYFDIGRQTSTTIGPPEFHA